MIKFVKSTFLIAVILLSLTEPAQAQSSDSTSLPWTAGVPSTFEPAPQSGTRCGSVAWDMRGTSSPENAAANGYIGGAIQALVLCKGHNPMTSCPIGYIVQPAGESGLGLYFFTCSKT